MSELPVQRENKVTALDFTGVAVTGLPSSAAITSINGDTTPAQKIVGDIGIITNSGGPGIVLLDSVLGNQVTASGNAVATNPAAQVCQFVSPRDAQYLVIARVGFTNATDIAWIQLRLNGAFETQQGAINISNADAANPPVLSLTHIVFMNTGDTLSLFAFTVAGTVTVNNFAQSLICIQII